MKTKKRILAIFAFLTMISSVANADEYYVSTNGSDSNSGTKKQPFQTIAKATSVMKSGDDCIIMEGYYPEVIQTRVDGTADNPVVYKNYKDDRVVLDATEFVNGWTKHEGNIYKVNKKLFAEKDIYNTLYYNDELMDIARWPNNVDNDKFTLDGHYVDGGSSTTFNLSGIPEMDYTGAYFCYLGAHCGTTWSRSITKCEKGVADKVLIHHEGVDLSKWPYDPHNPTLFRNGNFGMIYLYGKLELLDCPGEWFYDEASQTIYAMFPNGVAPKDGMVKVGARRMTAELKNDYVTIDGVECFGGSILVAGDGCKVTNSKAINCSQSLEGLVGISAQSEVSSILITGDNIEVSNCLVEGGQTNGISCSSRNVTEKGVTIRNNVVRYFNTIGIHANPIRSRNDYVKVINNSVYTCGRDGITTFGKYCEIAYNDVFDCMRINNDGGVYYTVGNENLKHSSVHHNYIHDSYGPDYADGRAAGIYLDSSSKGYDVYNNVIWNVTWGAFMFNWSNTDFNIYNNSIWDCGFNVGRWEFGHSIARISVINNYSNVTVCQKMDNVPADPDWIGTDFKTNIVDGKSPFVSVENCDFRPAAESGLVDKGTFVEALNMTFKGKSPDIGAYEYGEKLWNVGASWAAEVLPADFVYGSKRDPRGLYGQTEMEADIFKYNSNK